LHALSGFAVKNLMELAPSGAGAYRRVYDESMPQDNKGTNWRAWAVGILSALVLIVCLQNSQQVSVDVLFVSTEAPLIVILLVAVAVGALIGYVTPVLRRHRRDERALSKD
jgi:uncharacterized integral membrane protein